LFDTGNAHGDELGGSLTISGDGTTMAVGAYFGDPNDIVDAGYVRLYTKDGTNWRILQELRGTQENEWFGWSVSLSYDGSVLTIGSFDSAFHIYELSNASSLYTLLDTKIYNTWAATVSSDGRVIGVTNSDIANTTTASFYQRSGTDFVEMGRSISGYSIYAELYFSYDGSVAIIGDYSWSNNTGRVSAFQFNINGGWAQMGDDIEGNADNDRLGLYGCLSITHNGLIVAVGAQGYDGKGNDTNTGVVRVYRYDGTSNTWNQRGDDLVGESPNDSFSTTALSSDGVYLTVGTSSDNIGYVIIYEWSGSNYDLFKEPISDEYNNSHFGFYVDSSADGSVVAIGAYGHENNTGRVYVYETGLSTTSSSSFVRAMSGYGMAFLLSLAVLSAFIL